jgi:hypothetical protein
MIEKHIVFEKQHGNIDFPFHIVYNDSTSQVNNGGNFIYCHWHHEYEFILVIKGRAMIEINAKPVEAWEGEGVVINSNDKYFRNLSGVTPITYINQYRINAASILLKETQLSVLDIAMNTGFENFSFFIKMFKKQNGCTPNNFRKINV